MPAEKDTPYIFVDNSVQNLNAAQKTGINTVLFNRDHEIYSGNTVNNFRELDSLLLELFAAEI